MSSEKQSLTLKVTFSKVTNTLTFLNNFFFIIAQLLKLKQYYWHLREIKITFCKRLSRSSLLKNTFDHTNPKQLKILRLSHITFILLTYTGAVTAGRVSLVTRAVIAAFCVETTLVATRSVQQTFVDI